MSARRPTLSAVADAAGVSLKTASRVLNDEPNVAAETRERVRAAAEALGFRRNRAAADLARGGTSTLVGFVTADLANTFYSAVAAGLERELRESGLQLVSASSAEDPEQEQQLAEAFVERRVAALVVAPSSSDHSYLAPEVAAGLPLVLIDRPARGVDADTVVIDNRGGTASAVEHLLAGGHRRIAMVGDLPHLWTFQERRDQFLESMRAAGVADAERLVRDGAHDSATARRLVAELLALPEPPTAIVAANNKITVGALHALRGVESDLPALVGFDDFELADLLGVTVVSYDADALGCEAARLAMARMDDGDGGTTHRVIPTRLVARGSGERPPA
ncbi:LacI family DNA-binding transcriptional regulator [Cellulomonas sp. PhB143]|uniref:LacI family DNA-binding transcriptional regulator n=1 Tax=Cellulomonas sp. PhB143 TaxID=2485186 RepID=UPI000F47B8E3|nr:LacI family DNA-binding transcriptional regulator [Cellulomonas sp. PhB143]ROS72133.1 LacI family transcriptional regulator [Cellulomonas sp. PhB143]